MRRIVAPRGSGAPHPSHVRAAPDQAPVLRAFAIHSVTSASAASERTREVRLSPGPTAVSSHTSICSAIRSSGNFDASV